MKTITIIGGGPGGYVAAIRANQLGFKTKLIEKEELGGVCLNWGCIPTKALLKSAEVYDTIQNSSKYGLEPVSCTFNIDEIVQRSRKISTTLNQGIISLMRKNNVEVIKGHGKLKSSNEIIVHDTIITTDYVVLATGGCNRQLDILPIDHHNIWDYRDAMTPKIIPKKLVIVGAGAIGVEFAHFYNTFGSEVIVLEVADRILINEDEDISETAKNIFTQKGIKIITNTIIRQVVHNDHLKIIINDGEEIYTDVIISAVGVVPNTEDLGLINVGIETKKSGHILVNEYLQTNISNIYAIGDITNPPYLAHKASHEAIIAIEHIAGHNKKMHTNIPACTYSFPQVASIGLTEKQAKEQGHKINVGKFPLMANGKALANGSTDGMVKVIFHHDTGELLGAHMIGHEVTEMINIFALIKNAELRDLDLIEAIFAHPTLSESIPEAVLSSMMRAIHI